jgi:FkbM family methyltransferase
MGTVAVIPTLYRWSLRHQIQVRYRGGHRFQRLLLSLSPELRAYPLEVSGGTVYLDMSTANWQAVELFTRVARPHEPHIVSICRRFVRRSHIAIDVGANIGLHTVLLGSLAGRVIAIEPNPILLPGLRLTISHIPNGTLYECVAGDHEGVADLHVHDDHSQSSMGGSGRAVTVPMRRLDDLANHADFIKIDVEGAEALVFRGARRLLESSRPVIVYEELARGASALGLSRSAAGDLLHSFGYQLRVIDPDGRLHEWGPNRPECCDVLAVAA